MILMGQYPEQCGMMGECSCYMVVEADGSVYPCDFYCEDRYLLGEVSEGFTALRTKEKAEAFVSESRYDLKECLTCPYFRLCRGGCRRYREPFVEQRPGKFVLCEAYKIFFGKHLTDLRRLAAYILRINNGL
ncbi:MAG: SPASM domain-containing protein [Erysipelotrichaceae bacterium]|nr:SPASM domain-containing protein [Erysipelotrichaceae bacterium]